MEQILESLLGKCVYVFPFQVAGDRNQSAWGEVTGVKDGIVTLESPTVQRVHFIRIDQIIQVTMDGHGQAPGAQPS